MRALPALILGAAGIWLGQTYLNPYYLRLVDVVGINIILAVSLNLTNGMTGVFSLGHIAFMAVGAYSAALLTLPLPRKELILPDLFGWLRQTQIGLLPATLAGGVLAALCAALIGYSVLQLRGHYLAVATLGFLVIVRSVLVNWERVTRGGVGISGIPPYTTTWWTYGFAAACIYLSWRLTQSAFGRAMLAVREDESAAAAMGIPAAATRLISFVLGAFFAGTAGSLWAHLITVISPNSFWLVETFNLVVMIVVGGLGSTTGAVVGAIVLTLIPEALRSLEGGIEVVGITLPPLFGLSQLILAVMLILTMMLRPRGLVGGWEARWPRLPRLRQVRAARGANG
ncbi:MAG: branched-chain amino acid ABC transporter permease [Armatimonadota bacterium]|nr:branched-chain amino acid ABC transporter permease [Armatimonadota bacterium]MDR7426665.1 branched-chain amino acid ABC transporter permease [Armatimonadota bacterium]MDR7464372.1 branched-chain amino acid ABC transporter permease [Armatimonadota bacterium]MDR7469216.1 branched-chain amino acid ABC transporter permease [Armatimonadota bacterium]MDR7475073.1 branched-chain amino acid ABC transporter permease [Armatimonadota bacterium]